VKALRVLAMLATAGLPALCQTQTAVVSGVASATVSDDTVVVQAGDVSLTKAEYERLVIGFDRASGATTTGAGNQAAQSGKDVARLLALVSAAKSRGIDRDPVTAAQIKVRGYVLLANTLLVNLREGMTKDEAGTRALWASDENTFVQIHARQILIRYKDAKDVKPGAKGASRAEADAKVLAASLYAKVKAGGDFAALAKANSDDETTSAVGGELPEFSRGTMTAEFETVAFGLANGATSEPFKTSYGYHIAQVLEHRRIPFEKVKAALEDIRARKVFESIATSGIELNPSYFKK
jgi:parvulin-like peptidyl-prolyl isomerase